MVRVLVSDIRFSGEHTGSPLHAFDPGFLPTAYSLLPTAFLDSGSDFWPLAICLSEVIPLLHKPTEPFHIITGGRQASDAILETLDVGCNGKP